MNFNLVHNEKIKGTLFCNIHCCILEYHLSETKFIKAKVEKDLKIIKSPSIFIKGNFYF